MKEMVKTKEFKDFWDYFKTAIISINQFAEYPDEMVDINDKILEKTLREWKTKRKQRLKDIQFSHKVSLEIFSFLFSYLGFPKNSL